MWARYSHNARGRDMGRGFQINWTLIL